jgi:hypothetical protein
MKVFEYGRQEPLYAFHEFPANGFKVLASELVLESGSQL